MNLRTKVLLFILMPTILFFVGITGFISYSVNSTEIRNAEEFLETQGERLAHELSLELEHAFSSAKMIAQSFQAIIEKGITPNREEANTMLQQLLENNPSSVQAWMFWEPNAFDGKDEEYAREMGHDVTGRFIPVWYRFGSGFAVEPVRGYDEPGKMQEQLDHVLQTGESMIAEPFMYTVGDEDMLITSLIIPVTVNDKTIGMVGVDFSLENINAFMSEFTFYGSGFASLISNGGIVVAHKLEDMVGTNYLESNAMQLNESYRDAVRNAIQSGEQLTYEGYSETLKSDVYRFFTPVTIGDIKTPWTIMVIASVNEVTKEAKQLTTLIVSISVVVVIVLAVIIFLMTRAIVQPINAAVAHGQEMAAGDFTRDVSDKYLRRKDEIGDLARIYELITKSMRELIGRVQQSTNLVLQSTNTLDESTRQATSAANEVATSIEEVAQSAENQMQSAEESAKSLEDMTQGVQRVAQTASHLSETVTDMSEFAKTGQQTVQNAIEQMDRIQGETQTTKTAIEQLKHLSDKIETIVAVITDISEQTNLLALNAAIEAARAGDAGRGFAVVADEVRQLADETKGSASDIQQLVYDIQAHTVQAVQSMDANETEVHEGITRIQEVGEMFDQILNSIQNVVGEIEEMSAVSEEMSAISEQIAAAAEEIASSSEDSSSHAQQVAAAAEEQLATMEDMSKASEALKSLVDDLGEVINRFKA